MLGVQDFETLYTTDKNVKFFCKSINMSCSGVDEFFLLEPRSKEKRVSMVVLADLEDEFFYMHLLVVYDLGC